MVSVADVDSSTSLTALFFCTSYISYFTTIEKKKCDVSYEIGDDKHYVWGEQKKHGISKRREGWSGVARGVGKR